MTTIKQVDFWLARHRQAAATVQPVYAQLQPDDLERMTPCAGWDLRQLLSHLVGQDHGFAAAIRGDVDVDAFQPRPLEGDLTAALSASLASVHQSFGAADPDRSVLLPEFERRRFPLAAVIGFHFLDTLVHGWDIAATIGIPVNYDQELVAGALTQARGVPDGPLRDRPGAAFDRPLTRSNDADPWRETLLWLGRDPDWAGAAGRPPGQSRNRSSA